MHSARYGDGAEAEDRDAAPTIIRVLLIEDSPGDRSLTTAALHGRCAVTCASTLGEALALLAEAEYDCVLADLGLPDAEGLDVVDALAPHCSACALMVLTGRDDDAVGVASIRRGATEYLVKREIDSGHLPRVLTYASERVRARAAAEQAGRFQAVLLAAVGQAVVVTDTSGIVEYWNPAAEQLLGWRADEVVGGARPRIERAADLSRAVTDTLEHGAAWSGDAELARRDGATVPAFVTVSPVLDAHQQLRSIIITAVDVTERKAAEETAQILSSIVATSADAIHTIDLDGVIGSWNAGAERMLGYSPDEVLGTAMGGLGHSDEETTRLLARIGHGDAIESYETTLRHREGRMVEVSLSVSPMCDETGSVVAASMIARDITESRRMEGRLRHQALYDTLTGLPNRTLLNDRLALALARAQRSGQPLAVLFCDVDHLKRINDGDGHLVGDELLKAVAARLAEAVRPADTVARFGGDEFVIVCEGTDERQGSAVARRLAAAMADPFLVVDRSRHVTVSVGIAVSSALGADASAMLSGADAAMYAAKTEGRARWKVFDQAMSERADRQRRLADDLRAALSCDDLRLFYQPQVEMVSGRLTGLEALLRWCHPTDGWISPVEIVAVAEDFGLAWELDDWVLRRACMDAVALLERGVLPGDGRIAVNRSARTITDHELARTVLAGVQAAGLTPGALEIEMTETSLLRDLGVATGSLVALRRTGVSVALDNFGTGYSSLSYVKKLPVSTVKIDRSFVASMLHSSEDLAICASIIELGTRLRLRTVAEGIETVEQLERLQELGCNTGQGYLWSPAVPFDALPGLILDRPGPPVLSATAPRV